MPARWAVHSSANGNVFLHINTLFFPILLGLVSLGTYYHFPRVCMIGRWNILALIHERIIMLEVCLLLLSTKADSSSQKQFFGKRSSQKIPKRSTNRLSSVGRAADCAATFPSASYSPTCQARAMPKQQICRLAGSPSTTHRAAGCRPMLMQHRDTQAFPEEMSPGMVIAGGKDKSGRMSRIIKRRASTHKHQHITEGRPSKGEEAPHQ